MNELDDDLKRRISEVFDNFEDPTAEEGWMLLREKYPPAANHRGTAWLWWASAAAMFLLVLGIGIWINMKPADKPETYTKNTVKKERPAINTPAETTTPQKETAPATANNNTTVAPVTDNTDAVFTPQAPTLARRSKKVIKTIPDVDIITPDVVTTPAIVSVPPNNGNTPAVTVPQQQPANVLATVPATQTPAVTDNNKPVIQPSITPDVIQPVQASVVEKKPASQQAAVNRSFLAMLEKEGSSQASAKQTKAKNDKAVNFGVYAATYVNYAKGSDNNVNVGAGVSSDFRISKNVKLSTGVSIAQNSFNYGGAEIPRVASEASLVAKSVQTLGFGPASSAPTVQNYNASLVGIDIPLNIKFEFNPEKNDTYISAGLSSGTFINESYTYKYNYNAPFSSTATQQVDEKINEQFNEFYFAKTLNLAFGIGYPLGKNNRLVIEPFVKYPLAGLGVQQIKFGAGGINLKLNFQTRKK
jgi:hypothetical protein